jgi:hypothetical protein
VFSVDANTPREKINLLGQVLDFSVNHESTIGKFIFQLYSVWRILPNLSTNPRPSFGEYLAKQSQPFADAVDKLLTCTGVHLPMNTGLGDMVATRDVAFATSFLLDFTDSARKTRTEYKKSRKDSTRIEVIGIEDEDEIQLKKVG